MTSHPEPKVERSSSVMVITLTGERDPHVEDDLAHELKGIGGRLRGCQHLLLDFHNVDYLTSRELGTLINLNRQVKDAGARLTLFNLNERVQEILRITHLNALLGVCQEELNRATAAVG